MTFYAKLQFGFKYLHYRIKASNGKGHGIHSPFVFDFIKNVLNDNKPYAAYAKVEKFRTSLLKNQQKLQVEDLGAGSQISNSFQRTVSSIARKAAKPPKYGQLLFRLARYYHTKNIIEAGTSLGITTSYLALANPAVCIVTLEGASEVADQALKNFKDLQLNNIKLLKGNFDDTLSQALKEWPSFDLVFIDGNHRKDPTINYFNQVLDHVHNDSILIFDDIHWSNGMEEAWDIICANENVTLTIDLFFIGIVFFRKEIKIKQHFMIRF